MADFNSTELEIKNEDGTTLERSLELAASSSTTPLGIAGLFSGPITDSGGYNSIKLAVNSNQSSFANGLIVYWYDDNVGTTIVGADAFSFTASQIGVVWIPQVFSLAVKSRYFQVYYINNATTAQTFFSLKSMLSTTDQTATAVSPKAHFLNQTGTAMLTRNVNDRLYNVGKRSFVKKTLTNGTLVGGAGTTIHPVTAQNTFYMTGYQITATAGTTTAPSFVLQDGTDTTDRIAFRFRPQDTTIALQGDLQANGNFENNPIPFTSDVRAILLTGTVVASITIWGYEEGV